MSENYETPDFIELDLSTIITHDDPDPIEVWTMESRIDGSYGIMCRGWEFATVHYDYRFTNNAERHIRAEKIVSVPGLIARIRDLKRQNTDLQIANNGYLERARAAEEGAERTMGYVEHAAKWGTESANARDEAIARAEKAEALGKGLADLLCDYREMFVGGDLGFDERSDNLVNEARALGWIKEE